MKNLAWGIVIGSIPLILAYCGGAELERGPYLATTIGMALFAGIAAYTFPKD